MLFEQLKNGVRKILQKLPFALTKNLQYDRQTEAIMRRILGGASHCIDIGCHKGEMLDLMLELAPNGVHYGFEPIPTFYQNLKKKYPQARILDIGLSNTAGKASFNFVVSNPAYSGLKRRQYARAEEQIEIIEVKTDLLDHVLPEDWKVDFIKIDVEGGELQVLEGARKTLARTRATVVFEHGLGGSEYYDATPQKVYALIVNELGMKISTMKRFLAQQPPLAAEAFYEIFYSKKEYYFIAYFD
jgi:FkbM family methyltransferase